MNRFFKFVGLSILAVAVAFASLNPSISYAEDNKQAIPKHNGAPHALGKLREVGAKFPDAIKPDDVPQYLQDISVTIRASAEFGGGAEGSGVFKVTKDGQVWVWTCGHLVEHLRTERKNSNGKTVVEFADAKIIKVLTEEGRKVGELNFDAEVIRYSDKEHGDDLALLRVRSKKYKPAASTVFYAEKPIPAIGTKVMHCGSLLGQLGSNSVTNGIISQHGRVLFHSVIFDQTNAASFPGSSGGIVCLEKNGQFIGMVVRGAGETFSLFVPIRRMRTWAKKVGVEFALDDKLPVPSDEELMKLAIDDSLRGVNANKEKKPHAHAKAFPTKERTFQKDTVVTSGWGILSR